MFREGGPWGGGTGCWSPHTSHLPTLALGSWSLLSLAGTGPSWPSDPRPGSGSHFHLSISPVHLATCLWPLSPFLNLGMRPQGTGWLAGPEGRLIQCLGNPSPWDTCNPGPPRSQADFPGREPDGTPLPPSPAPAGARSGPRPGRSRGRLHVFGRWRVCPAQGGRQERGPERPARLGSSPREAGEGRCGRHPQPSNHLYIFILG